MPQIIQMNFNYKRVVGANGTVFCFDGRYTPETDTLTVTRVYGDVTKMNEFRKAAEVLCHGGV